MEYKYVQKTSFSKGFAVKYNTTPDFTSGKIFIDDEIKIDAEFTNYGDSNIISIFVYINGETVYTNTKISISGGWGKETVSITFKLPSTFNHETLGQINFGAQYFWAIYQYPTKKTVIDSKQTYNIAGTSYNINISDFSFERTSLKDGGYVNDNQGKNLICKNFLIVPNDDTLASDFQIKKIKLTSGSETIVEKDLDLSILESAMSDGYSETSPLLFEGYEFELTKNYRIDLTLGNENEVLIRKSSFLYPGYSNMHLSGAKKGGVAFGGFSTSTDDNPLFESYYPATFYQGLTDISLKMFGNAIYPVGSIFICNGEADPNVIFGGKWEQLDNLYLRPSKEKIGEIEGIDEITVSIPHYHIAPIAVDSGLVGAVEIEADGSDTYSADNARYANATVAHSGRITRDMRFYHTSTYSMGTSVTINPRHLNVAMWERKTLYDIEQDVEVPTAAIRQINMKRLEAAK